MDPSSLGIDCCARAVEQCLSTRSTGRRDELRLRVGHGVCRDDKCLPSDLPDLSHRRRILTAACCLAEAIARGGGARMEERYTFRRMTSAARHMAPAAAKVRASVDASARPNEKRRRCRRRS